MFIKRKIPKIVISGILLILFVIGLGLWQPKPKVDTVSNSQILEKMQQALQSKGEIVLSEDEANSIIKEGIQSHKQTGNFKIENLEIELQGEALIFNIFVKYKGLTVFLTTQGELSYENPFISYTMNSIKIGKIPIPKNLFLALLSPADNSNIIVEQGTIKIHKTYLPLALNSLAIKDENIIIGIDLKENLDHIKDSTKKELQQGVQEEVCKILETLDEVKKKLPKEAQKNAIDDIQESLKDFMENPTEDFSIDQEEIKKLYDSLPFQKKLEIYSSISSEVDLNEWLK